jgi:hypothetical protein
MPIRLTAYPPDRLVIGVATDVVTVADLADFLRQLTEGELHRFRKIIDISGARTDMTPEELATFGEGLRLSLKDTPRGAMAIVTGDQTGELARLFSGVTGAGRPVDVFRSLHEARRWLNTNAFPG